MSDTIDAVAHAMALNTQRQKAWEEGKRLLADIEARTDKTWTGEDTQEWERINADIDRLDRERDVYLTASRRETESAEIRDAELRDLGEHRVATRDYNEREHVREIVREMGRQPAGPEAPVLSLDLTPAFRERQMIRDGIPASEARALAWDTGSIASGVPVTTARSLYEYLEAGVAMFRMPTTKIQTGSGEQMKFPKLAAHAIATQVIAQGTAIGGTDPTFGSLTLDAYKFGELVKVANEVLTDTVFDVGAFLTRDIGRALARVIDADLVVGTGTNEPNGVVTATVGSVITGGSLITPTYENLVDVVYGVNDAYRQGGVAWLMRDASAAIIRKIRDGAGGTIGQPIWQMSPWQGLNTGQPDSLLNYPVYTDPNVPAAGSNAKLALFGDFSAYYIRTVGSVDIARDSSRYFDTDETAFRGKWRVDGDLLDTSAIIALKQNV